MRIPFIQNSQNTSNQAKLMVALTPDGRKAAESWEAPGSKWEVLAALATAQRPLSLGILARECNMSYGECLKICRDLKSQGYVCSAVPGSMGVSQ